MKKEGLLVFTVLLLAIFILPLISAQVNSTNSTNSGMTNSLTGVDKAYQCLTSKVENLCDTLTLEQQTFALLALSYDSGIQSECKSEILSELKNEECWPKNSGESTCNIKQTAQSILALNEVKSDTEKQKTWLLNQKAAPSGLTWYLQIESNEEASCKITYGGSSYNLNIGANKKLSGGAGSCLSLATGGYWLQISQNCLDTEFSVSCSQSFLTNQIYRKSTSSTIFVSEKTQSASPEGTTIEKVEAFCLKSSGAANCDYEGTLWGALALEAEDREQLMPYLLAFADENPKFMPDAFIYSLTDFNDFYVNLLSKQKQSKFWDESGDKFYDTAVALFPFQSQEPIEKTNALNWLLEVQDTDGCWSGNVRNTAFLLYSGWPRKPIIDGPSTLDDCTTQDYFCLSAIKCEIAGGEEIGDGDLYCPGTQQICCTEEEKLQTCDEQLGKICDADEQCVGGQEENALLLNPGETCCLQGSCQERVIEQLNECEEFTEGSCKFGACGEGETINEFNSCPSSGEVCCVPETEEPGEGINIWIIILVVLIVVVLLGILFRNKLRPLLSRRGSGSGSTSLGQRPRPGFPPTSPGSLPSSGLMRPMPRRILPPNTNRPVMMRQPRASSETEKRFEETLKKLRESKR